jgi:Asp-tRNA(Asn)/Glu-tRNA(Gln) amidotransferase B subunit
MNSLRFIQAAIDYEARRQIAIVEGGGEVVQETRLYDPDKGETRSMRSKEEAHDYRYFPDPDLLPLEIEQAWVDDIAGGLPELPDAKKARFMGDYGLSDYDASVLTTDLDAAAYFEDVVAGSRGSATASSPRTGSSTSFSAASRRKSIPSPKAPSPPPSSAPSSRSSNPATSPARSPRTCSRSSIPRAATRPRSSRRAA